MPGIDGTNFTIAIVTLDEVGARGCGSPLPSRLCWGTGCGAAAGPRSPASLQPRGGRLTGRGYGAGGARGSYKSLCKPEKQTEETPHLCKAWAVRSASSDISYVACGAPQLGHYTAMPARARGDGGTQRGALCPHVQYAYEAHLHYCLLPVMFYIPRGEGGRKMRQMTLQTSYSSAPKLSDSCFTSDVVLQPGGSDPEPCQGQAESKAAANQYPASAAWKRE